MHESVMSWVGKVVASLPGCAEGITLEVGSCQVNGGVREFFTGPYLGVDIVPGEGVDLVIEPEAAYPNPGYDTIVSTEMLEHDIRPWVSLARMYQALKPEGHLILTCRGFDEGGSFGYHNPPDRWRYSQDAMRILAEDAGFEHMTIQRDPQAPGWFLHAKR